MKLKPSYTESEYKRKVQSKKKMQLKSVAKLLV